VDRVRVSVRFSFTAQIYYNIILKIAVSELSSPQVQGRGFSVHDYFGTYYFGT